VNLAGEVIGVNSLAARNGSIGIAVPSSLIKLVLSRLVAGGRPAGDGQIAARRTRSIRLNPN